MASIASTSSFSLLAFTVAASIVACGGAPKPVPVTGNTASTSDPAKAGGGHSASGVGTLAWGANADAIMAAYPQTTVNQDGGYWTTGVSEGITSLTLFKMTAGGLDEVGIEWTEGFADMDACGKGFAKVRAAYDGRFGASHADNLSAEWTTPTSHVTLGCTPNEIGAGVLSAHFTHPGTK